MKNGVLYRNIAVCEVTKWQIVLPASHRHIALKGVHEDLFHTHYEDGLAHLRMRFFWLFMAKELRK